MRNYKLLPEHIHLLDLTSSIVLFFHSESLQIYPLYDESILSFLRMYKQEGYEKTKSSYSEQDFYELYHFGCKTIRKYPGTVIPSLQDSQTESFNNIVLPITAGCNLNCPYCFAQTDGGFHFGNFTNNAIDQVANFLISNNFNKSTPITILFFGGEPLINFEIIKYTISHFKEKYPEYNIQYSITTNGTILNNEIIKVFKENNVTVLVSLDGYENKFNLRRFKIDGNSSVDIVVKNIKQLKKNGVNLEVRATLVNDNPYILKTFVFFEQLKLPFNVIFAYSSENKTHNWANYNEDNLASIRKQFDKILSYYIKKVEKRETIYNKLFLDRITTLRFRINRSLSCSGGINYFTITANGDIYSCAHLMNNPEYKIGNIMKGIGDKSDYIAIPIDEIDECKGCWANKLCLGGCVSQKISMGRSNKCSKPSNECELEKLTWDLYLKLYYYIMKIAPEYFKRPGSNSKSC